MSPKVLVNIRRLTVSYGSRKLFGGLSFSVRKGELVALVGANGSGKSTLLRLLADTSHGITTLDDSADLRITGEITVERNTEITYLPQYVEPGASEGTDYGHVREQSFSETLALGRKFGLPVNRAQAQVLSGGELQKRAIINCLLQDSRVLLLDEPTNFLDLPGIIALEDQLARLKSRGKAILLVTHDRELTDKLADKTVLISPHGIFVASGGASTAFSIQADDYTSRDHRAAELRKKISQLQRDARARAGWAADKEKQKIGAGSARAHIAKQSKKMAQRSKAVQRRADLQVEKLEKTKPFVPKRVSFKFPQYEIRHKEVISLRDVGFGYNCEEVTTEQDCASFQLRGVNLTASTRDRICLMGANGSGKTTLLELINRRLVPDSGSSYLNDSVNIASIPQGLEGVFPKKRLLDNFSESI